jgi:hypothetical protein
MARVLFPIVGADVTQLTAQPGDVILVMDKSHSDWYKGEIDNSASLSAAAAAAASSGGAAQRAASPPPPQRGLFPASFTFELTTAPSSSSDDARDFLTVFEAQGDYKGDASQGHLTLARGDLLLPRQKHSNGWWQVTHGATRAVGWAPSNFLKPCERFPPLTAAQEEKLTAILARVAAGPSSHAAAASPSAASSSSPSPPVVVGTVSKSSGGGLLNSIKMRLGGGTLKSPPGGRSMSVSAHASSSPPPVSPGMFKSPSPSNAAAAGSSPPPRPPLPARQHSGADVAGRSGRSQSVLTPGEVASMPPEKRRGVMATLAKFFTSRPSKEQLQKKKILHKE